MPRSQTVSQFVESLESEVRAKIPKEILDGLLYTEEDVSASQDRVILSQYLDNDDLADRQCYSTHYLCTPAKL